MIKDASPFSQNILEADMPKKGTLPSLFNIIGSRSKPRLNNHEISLSSRIRLALKLAAGVWMLLLVSQQASAMSALDLLNVISPAGGVGVSKDIAYGEETDQNLDVYYPKTVAQNIQKTGVINERYPLVIFIHGGSWENGNKDQYAFVGQSFAQAGYVTVVINYRKAPEFIYPAFVEDSAQAIAWCYRNADKLYANADKIAVVGQSAGAFNAVAAVSNIDFLAPYGMKPSDIKAVVGIAGPYSYDFRKFDSRTVFPSGATPNQVMPDRLIQSGADGKQPAYLLLTAENDHIVHDSNTEKMLSALQAVDAKVHTEVIKNASHATSIGAMATPLRGLNDVRQQVLDYLQRTFKAESE